MANVKLQYSSSEEFGVVEVESEHPKEYYENDRNFHLSGVGCDKSVSEKDARYLKFMDHTGYRIAKHKYGIETLARKRINYSYPHGFDHTTMWGKKGDYWPLFVLTEPYHIAEDDKRNWYHLKNLYDLDYLILTPSKRSLWYPDKTYMVFWWCPTHFDLKSDKSLFGYPDSDEVLRSLTYKTIAKVPVSV